MLNWLLFLYAYFYVVKSKYTISAMLILNQLNGCLKKQSKDQAKNVKLF